MIFLIIFFVIIIVCQGSNDNYQRSLIDNNQLEQFYLRNSSLKIFRLDFYSLSLNLIDISENQFETISISPRLVNQSHLRQFICRSNRLKRLDFHQIVFPHSLERISFAKNQLEILDARLFTRLKYLIELDLTDNQLKRISPIFFLKQNLLLDRNPLDCHCTAEPYRTMCQHASSINIQSNSSKLCFAPHSDEQIALKNQFASYLRFSTTTFVCPINGEPKPMIIWSTPFGNLTAHNASTIDLLIDDGPLYIKLIALLGPLTARTKHILHAFDDNHLSITRTRAALNHRLSCSAVNMLGSATYEFQFEVKSFVKRRVLWQMLFSLIFGLIVSLLGGLTCFILKQTRYYPVDKMETPPLYPTMTPNSAARTPPNFEFNQWFSSAAANISETLEQVRDKLRQGVQQVSEHMGQTMGRASEFITHGVQTAGGTIRQAATTSAAYLRETSQQALNTVRVQTLSSLRNSGQFMRARMNIITTQMNSLKDYCGVTTGPPLGTNHSVVQVDYARDSPLTMSRLQHHHITTIMEDDESMIEMNSSIHRTYLSPYAGYITSTSLTDASGVGHLDRADQSVQLALKNFQQYDESSEIRGQMSGGIGTFHTHAYEQEEDEEVEEAKRLTIDGQPIRLKD